MEEIEKYQTEEAEIEIWKGLIYDHFVIANDGERLSYINALVELFGFEHGNQEKAMVIEAVMQFFQGYTMKNYMYLEKRYRKWNIEWEKQKRLFATWKLDNIVKNIMRVESQEGKRLLLIFCSMHSSGYVREASLLELSKLEETLPFFVLRMNDWVHEVRELAFLKAMERIHTFALLEESISETEDKTVELLGYEKEILWTLPVFERVNCSNRKDQDKFNKLKSLYHEQVNRLIIKLDVSVIAQSNQDIRNTLCMWIYQNNLLPKEQLEDLLNLLTDSFPVRILLKTIVRYYGLSESEFIRYRKYNNNIIRKFTIDYWIGENGLWKGAEEYLMDQSRSIRSDMQFYFKRDSDLNQVAYYLSNLMANTNERECVACDKLIIIALMGLGELGAQEALPEILPFLENPDCRIQKAALEAIGDILKEDGYQYYLRFLQSDNLSLVKTAYTICKKCKVYYGSEQLIELYEKSADEQKGICYLRLLGKESFWKCATFYLNHFGKVSEEHQKFIEKQLWGFRPMYNKLPNQLKTEIEEAMVNNQNYLPEKLCKEIRYDLKFL